MQSSIRAEKICGGLRPCYMKQVGVVQIHLLPIQAGTILFCGRCIREVLFTIIVLSWQVDCLAILHKCALCQYFP